MPGGTGTVCLPLGPSTSSSGPTVIFTPFGSGIGFFPTLDINLFLAGACYHTWHKISPPTPSLRADDPVITPRGVVMILIPKPPNTRGTSFDPTYTRQPGRETRSMRVITGTFPGVYLR